MKKQTQRWILSSFVLATVYSGMPVHAETGPLGFGEKELQGEMLTDRPDFTESTGTVQAGHIQFETGYTYARNDDGGLETETHTVPELLTRIGVREDTELRLFWQGYIHEDFSVAGGEESSVSGVSDFAFGFKHHLWKAQGLLPESSFMAELGMPVGSSELTSTQVQPIAKFLWSYDLSEVLALAGNINADFPMVDDERFLELSSSVSVAWALTARTGIYAEYFGFYPDETDVAVTTRHFANGGFTYLLNRNLQLDVRAGLGLNDAADDFFSGAGVSFRL